MSGSSMPPRVAPVPGFTGAGAVRDRGLAAAHEGDDDALEQPINSGPKRTPPRVPGGRTETGSTTGGVGNGLEGKKNAENAVSSEDFSYNSDEEAVEILDSAQPLDEGGVTDDMSTLAINPAQLHPGGMDLNGSAEVPAGPAGEGDQIEDQKAREALHLSGDFADLDDAAIMLELKAGNMAGFDFLIQKYRKPIINFMYRMTRNQAVAEELAQEVFLRVYRSRETYRAEARFSTWLYRIATNLGVNQARDTRHERAASTVYLDEADSESGMTPDVADSTPDVESRMLRDERMAAIREYVMALPERQRMAVLMHKYEGMDYGQIGEVLKLSESATKSLLFRAYQTLREKLKCFV
jgi:RNA polymerase sigma-70 factor (ECF subfamily)